MSLFKYFTPSGDKIEFVEIREHLDDNDIQSLIEIGDIGRIQSKFLPERDMMVALNERYFSLYPQTGFRLYSGEPDYNLSDLQYLRNIQKLAIDSYHSVTNINILSELPALRSASIHIELKDFAFLTGLNDQLEQLSLETKSAALDLSVLCRFQKLKVLSFHKFKKNIAALSALPLLESLTLQGVTLDDLQFINEMKRLRLLKMLNGNTQDFSELDGNESLIAIQLHRITGLDNIDFLAALPNLTALELSWLRHLSRLPDLSGPRQLRHILLDDMKSLTDLSQLEQVSGLESVSFSVCPKELEAEHILPVLRNASVKQCSFFSASQKRNVLFQNLIEKYGKKCESNIITVRKILHSDFNEF